MKTLTVLGGVFAAISSVYAQQGCVSSALSLIPQCGQSCLLSAQNAAGCNVASTDFRCGCEKSEAVEENPTITQCVLQACKQDVNQALKVSSGAKELCKCVATAAPEAQPGPVTPPGAPPAPVPPETQPPAESPTTPPAAPPAPETPPAPTTPGKTVPTPIVPPVAPPAPPPPNVCPSIVEVTETASPAEAGPAQTPPPQQSPPPAGPPGTCPNEVTVTSPCPTEVTVTSPCPTEVTVTLSSASGGAPPPSPQSCPSEVTVTSPCPTEVTVTLSGPAGAGRAGGTGAAPPNSCPSEVTVTSPCPSEATVTSPCPTEATITSPCPTEVTITLAQTQAGAGGAPVGATPGSVGQGPLVSISGARANSCASAAAPNQSTLLTVPSPGTTPPGQAAGGTGVGAPPGTCPPPQSIMMTTTVTVTAGAEESGAAASPPPQPQEAKGDAEVRVSYGGRSRGREQINCDDENGIRYFLCGFKQKFHPPGRDDHRRLSH
ncbi:hypothetical protein IWX50DRAFT_695538 [Phyllosticta citricarpa]|uniref:CFEM domain-containing protein n=1 Tax=Phyllosticta citricarpa TaxID=55181 RepID=A0ABR1MKR4_9PEZI